MYFHYKKGNIIQGKLHYIVEDKSIDFSPNGEDEIPQSRAALTVAHTLQIEFDTETGRLLYVWGYTPKEGWRVHHENLALGNVTSGHVYVEGISNQLDSAVGYPSPLDDELPIFYPPSKLTFGNLQLPTEWIKIAEGTIVGINDNQLCALVLVV